MPHTAYTNTRAQARSGAARARTVSLMGIMLLRLAFGLKIAVAGYAIAEFIAVVVYFVHPTPATLMIAWVGLISGISLLLITVIAGQLAKRDK